MEILKHGMVSKRSVGKSAMSSIRGSNWKKYASAHPPTRALLPCRQLPPVYKQRSQE